MNRIEERYINLNVIVKLEDFNEEEQEGLIAEVKDSIVLCTPDWEHAKVVKVEVDTDKGLERR